MIPKVVYTRNGAERTIVFSPDYFKRMVPKWTLDKREYKNPFTGELTLKRRGYYFSVALEFEFAPYELLKQYSDIWNKDVTDLKFYPDKDLLEFFRVECNEEFEFEDEDTTASVLDFTLNFKGKDRTDVIMVHPDYFWGDRESTFAELTELFSTYEDFVVTEYDGEGGNGIEWEINSLT